MLIVISSNHYCLQQKLNFIPIFSFSIILLLSLISVFYDPFIGDGEVPSYRKLSIINTYGPAKLIEKEEDIGYVIKRISSRDIVRDYKGNWVTPIILVFGHAKTAYKCSL